VYREFWWGNLREIDEFEDPGVCGRTIFKKKNRHEMGLGAWTGLNWLRIGTGVRHLYGCNEHSGSIKCGEFFD